MSSQLIITEVDYSDVPKHIINVKIRSLLSVEASFIEAIISRKQVLWLLDAKIIIRTPSVRLGQPGPKVIPHPVKGTRFIKTEPNDEEEDNLSNLNDKIIVTADTYDLRRFDLSQLQKILLL